MSASDAALCGPFIVPGTLVPIRGASSITPSLVQVGTVLGGEVVAMTIWRGNLTVLAVDRVVYGANTPVISNACRSIALSPGQPFAQIQCTVSPGVGSQLGFRLHFCTRDTPPRCCLSIGQPEAAALQYPPPRLFDGSLRLSAAPLSSATSNLLLDSSAAVSIAFAGFALSGDPQLIQVRFGKSSWPIVVGFLRADRQGPRTVRRCLAAQSTASSQLRRKRSAPRTAAHLAR